MDIAIRPMTIEDYDEVYRLWSGCEGIGLSAADSRPNIEKFLAHNLGLCFTAWNGGALVGAVMCGCDGRRGYLHHLAVHPDLRRQGAGSALVDACLDALKARGIHKCHIFVYGDNQSGQIFWERGGWVRRQELLIMSRDLL